VISSFKSVPHWVQTSNPPSAIYTAVESQRAQATVGLAASGSGRGGTVPDSVPPARVVAGSNVVPQSAQTWLKQQLGVQL
jgi:hypothetical protein